MTTGTFFFILLAIANVILFINMLCDKKTIGLNEARIGELEATLERVDFERVTAITKLKELTEKPVYSIFSIAGMCAVDVTCMTDELQRQGYEFVPEYSNEAYIVMRSHEDTKGVDNKKEHHD